MEDRKECLDLLRFLRQYQLKETENCLRREYPLFNEQTSLDSSIRINDYFLIYSSLSQFILHSPYQLELIQFLFPLFLHIYLDFLEKNYRDEAKQFYHQFVHFTPFESSHEEFFYQLKLVSQSSTHLQRCCLIDAFRHSRFFLRLSMTSCNEIQNFLNTMKHRSEAQMKTDLNEGQVALVLGIFQENLKIDINKQLFSPSNVVRYQTFEQPMTPLFVDNHLVNTIQFTRLYTGVLPLDITRGGSTATGRRDLPVYYPQINYNRPLHPTDASAIPRLGPHQLPSICLFTLKSTKSMMINCVALSTDCRLLALGCQSSEILICSIDPKKNLSPMKSVRSLQPLLSTDQLLDPTVSINERLLIGHQSAIFALAFEPNEQIHLISGSQDCTIRLWHLWTWSCLAVYKMHCQPVLHVTFASMGHLFASCSVDGLLCLWKMEKINPIRIYPEYGHSGPIYLVEFHPNSNYLASAHHDHTIHLWNIHHENSLVRIFNGHRYQLSALKFSPNGHFLGSACWHGEFLLWDIQNNLQIAHLNLHDCAISSIEFSPLTGSLLLLSSIDGRISLWNCFMITKIYDEKLNHSSSSSKILLNVFRTKNTAIYQMRFSKENILYAIGVKDGG